MSWRVHCRSSIFLMADDKPLHTAARKGELAAMDVILSMANAAEMLGSRDAHNRTPLHLACFENHADAVEKLIAAGKTQIPTRIL